MGWLLAVVFKPFFLFGYMIFVAALEISARKLLPDCRIKRVLLRRW